MFFELRRKGVPSHMPRALPMWGVVAEAPGGAFCTSQRAIAPPNPAGGALACTSKGAPGGLGSRSAIAARYLRFSIDDDCELVANPPTP